MKLLFIHLFFWSRAKHIVEEMRDNYRVVLKLTVKKFNLSDLGTYTCVATNGLGKSEGAVRLYGKLLSHY